jgi:hypothetical protein
MNTNPPGMAGPGVHYITVSGFAPALPAVSAQTSVDVIVSAEAPGFSLSSSGNIQLSRGATTGNTATVSVTPSAGFIGIVKLACAVTASPTNAVDPVTCSIPSTVNVAGTTAASATLTVATTAHTSATLSQPSEKYLFGGGGAVLALLFFIGIPARRRFWRTLLGLMTVMSIISISGCGSSGSNGSNGGGNPGTTPGAYTITVTGTDAATGQISAKTSVTVTVN